MDSSKHKSGFVNIIGLPNVGKSTLLNAFMGEKMSIVSAKPQTTRHRLFGILNEENLQIVFSDSPGYVLDPSYKLHEDMNNFVRMAFKDADVILLITDDHNEISASNDLIRIINTLPIPKAVVINKIDKIPEERVTQLESEFKSMLSDTEIFKISALKETGVETLLNYLKEKLPVHPPFYPKDDISDKPVRFFVAEMIREQIFLNFRQEIPYSCEVFVEDYKDEENIARIYANIFVERNSQKAIILGKKGSAIKNIGIESRKNIENFIGKKVYLELTVKVRENWRNDIDTLRKFGYR